MSRKSKPGESIAEYAARVLGSGGVTKCATCKGASELESTRTENYVRRMVLDRDSLTGSGTAKFVRFLEDPNLLTLRRIASETDTDLDGAAEICETLRIMYGEIAS